MIHDEQLPQCSYSHCKIRDFLPFKCSLCTNQYCLEHKDPQQHECPHKPIFKKALICQKCKSTIPYESNQNEQFVLEQHKCAQIKQINKCDTCRLQLTVINQVQCQQCSKLLCLKHRFPDNHDCKKQGWCLIM